MKKGLIFLAFAALFWSVALHAAPVTPDRALDIARGIFTRLPSTKAGTGEIRLIWDGEFADDNIKASVRPAFYVISRDGGGWVIIAGDDNVQPILGISETGRFVTDGMPENVKWWMTLMKDYVRATLSQSPEIRSQWSKLTDTKSAVPQEFISEEFLDSRTPQWQQSEPFNLKAPTLEHQASQAIAGCLPIAMAEILTWFGQPVQGTGDLASYTYRYYGDDHSGPYYNTISGYTLSTVYDWASIQPLRTVSDCRRASDEVKDNLAQLVYDCGVMLGATFKSNKGGGTSASDSRVIKEFGEHMGYNKAARLELASDYSPHDWVNMLKAQVESHPVLYCGIARIEGGNDSSHAYVVDGFAKTDGEDVFHFNFGWNGFCDGYYSAFSQETIFYDYNTKLRALFDFYPNPDSEYHSWLEGYYDDGSHSYPGYNPGVHAKLDSDGSYTLSVSVKNRGAVPYSGSVMFALKKKDGSIEPINAPELKITNLGVKSVTRKMVSYVSIPSLSFGDSVICLYQDGDHYTQLQALPGSSFAEWPLIPAAFIATEETYHVGDFFIFALKNNNYLYAGSQWTITDPDGIVTESLPQSDGEFQLTKAGTYTIKVDVRPDSDSTVKESIVTRISVK